MSENKKSFKDTLNLPNTEFSIRANAKEKEPELLSRWQKEDLNSKTFTHNEGKEKFIFHDGPPYANGHIHMGTAFNKILKDIIAKARRMSGKQVPFTPGWDCHGLPIEFKVTSELGLEKDKEKIDSAKLKAACREYAKKWIDIQREEFKNLGALADWDNPYLTMNPTYEASIVKAFAEFVEQGYIERKGKTVPWCASCQTVLATAEIEHYDRKDPSCYIFFPLSGTEAKKVFPEVEGEIGFLVWTTTPWTIPLNRAVVLNPSATYVLLQGKDGKSLIVGKELADTICQALEIDKKVLAELPSSSFKDTVVNHPFVEGLQVPILLDDIVTLEDGTACMHMAPGCGPEDYLIAVKKGLEIFSPLTPDGKYAEGIAPSELEGMPVVDGQIWVIRKLAATGMLIHKTSIRHSYPHCWRCRGGLIFRATLQWFCNLQKGDLVKKTLKEIEKIKFVPEQGSVRLSSTISNRTEWCISRQRHWGVAIPALLCQKCDGVYLNKEFILKVAEGIKSDGIVYWDKLSVEEIKAMLPSDFACPSCSNNDIKSFEKETDILDVWFDSGISHFAVLKERKELGFPADLYLEGSDQHRGWFQSSLLTSMILNGEAQVKTIVTHGYVVDEKGRKMSKSLGNVTAPPELIEKYSRDILRLWVASTNYASDMIISDTVMKNVAEVYRKIRNTSRFLLSNLYDFDINKDAIELEKMLSIDQYALSQLQEVSKSVKDAYESCDITGMFYTLSNYCATDLSSFYLDIIKDRLYVEKSDGVMRRSAQTVCYHILDTLTRLMAPVLSFLGEEIFDSYSKGKTSIHLEDFACDIDVWDIVKTGTDKTIPGGGAYRGSLTSSSATLAVSRQGQWIALEELRGAVLKALEKRREEGVIRHSLEAKATIFLDPKSDESNIIKSLVRDLSSLETEERFFKDLFIVSGIKFAEAAGDLEQSELTWCCVKVEHADGVKCPRCWQWDVSEHPDELCGRCVKVLS